MQQADDYFHILEAEFQGLASGQKISTAVDVRAGYRKYIAGSHVIYFMPLPTGIEIVCILHHAMDVSRHLQGVT
jgi:toxin ParE1/3/4